MCHPPQHGSLAGPSLADQDDRLARNQRTQNVLNFAYVAMAVVEISVELPQLGVHVRLIVPNGLIEFDLV
jgi:hypothetical protein